MSCDWLTKLVDTNTLSKLDIKDITQLCSTIVDSKEFNPTYIQTTTTITDIDIRGVDSIIMKLKDPKRRVPVQGAKILYCGILKLWLDNNISNYILADIDLIGRTLTVVERLKNIDIIRSCAKRLAYVIHEENTCTGRCITVTPGKNISKCIFLLSDMSAISRFSPTGLVDVINSIAYIYIDDGDKTIDFVDLDQTYVSCSGSLHCNADVNPVLPTLKPSISVLSNLKKLHSDYVNTWCKHNRSKIPERMMLRDSIAEINSADTIKQIISITDSLMTKFDPFGYVQYYLEKDAK